MALAKWVAKLFYSKVGVDTAVSDADPLPVDVSNLPLTDTGDEPVFPDDAVVVRNIPYGTQTVSGVVTANPGGTFPVTQSGAWSTSIVETVTPDYAAGVSGTVSVPSGARIRVLSCHATTAATVAIDGGDSIPIPATVGFSDDRTPWLGPIDIVFTGTDTYYVSWAI